MVLGAVAETERLANPVINGPYDPPVLHFGIGTDGSPTGTLLKMATGSGKTVVMANLIAWHTLNKVHTPQDARFSKRFLVVTPGITIRDRLRVLLPSDPGNYYRERDLVPPDLWGGLHEAQVVITNYHQFIAKDRKEIQGVASNTRKILNGEPRVPQTGDQQDRGEGHQRLRRRSHAGFRGVAVTSGAPARLPGSLASPLT